MSFDKQLFFQVLHFPKKIKITTIALLFAASFFTRNGAAQVSNYTFEQLSGNYQQLTGGTVLGTASANNYTPQALWSEIYTVAPTFPFNFNGLEYTSFFVHSTGYISFGSPPTSGNYLPISTNQPYAGVISAWDSRNGFVNVGGRTSELRWQEIGTAPNRQIVIQWKDFRARNSTSTLNTPFMNYQIHLYETTNVIEIIYGESGYAAGGTTNTNATAQVGLRGGNFNDFNNRTNASSVSVNNSSAGTQRTDVQNLSTLNALPGPHADGKIYRWTPTSNNPPWCVHPDLWGTTAAPNDCSTSTITNIWAGQYSIINNVVAGNTYQFSSSIPTDWLVLTDANTNGILSGTSPITWTATFSGTVHLHVSTNNICNTDYSNFRNTVIECLTCCNPCEVDAPVVVVFDADCNSSGTAQITNYNAQYTYAFTPNTNNPVVNTDGFIVGLSPDLTYTVTADNGTCQSLPSLSFSIDPTQIAPTAPTNLACFETAVFNNASCLWEINATQPTAPTDLACYETATFNNGSCTWEVTGVQPDPPSNVACYQEAEFNTMTCSWQISGTQPPAPTNLACYETALFNDLLCVWEISGTQPPAPTNLACYETAVFNALSCVWVVSGVQPNPPTNIACYETAVFDDVNCVWGITGLQPPAPTEMSCYQTAVFNDQLCLWQIQGEQPEMPNLACYESAEFDSISCVWIINGDSAYELAVIITPSSSEIQQGGQVQLNSSVTPDSAQVTYFWSPADGLSCSDCPNPIAAPDLTTTYTLVVVDENGCQAVATALVKVTEHCPEIFIPTIFSPNNDGNNDSFCILGGCIDEMELSIYNRWGELVFQDKNQNPCWDGKFRNRDAGIGVYVYKVKIVQANGQEIIQSGNLTLTK